ncbi:Ribophorin II [Artemisia annua]|uniref:Dolichyl-diphosphooligosaccharide--protein glycosyltransferase subunit 2 n=1 Tax=Artemisia annua TaxID=35608 RepID=A0A2U1MFY0_ARTAN|nr:Ribophorin II [Artemisia annua]
MSSTRFLTTIGKFVHFQGYEDDEIRFNCPTVTINIIHLLRLLEEAYEALRTFEVLGIEKKPEDATCKSVVDTLSSASSNSKDLYHALRVNGLLKCKTSTAALEGIASRLKDGLKHATLLLDYYHSVGGLLLIKDQSPEVDVLLGNADGIVHSIKALSQSDGRWRYSSNNPDSSTYAAGIAFETISGVVSLAASAIDENLIGTLKKDIVKLFDSIEKYDDGAYYFDDKHIDASGHQGPLSATSAVVRGLSAFAATSGNDGAYYFDDKHIDASGHQGPLSATSAVVRGQKPLLEIPEDKILGLARLFLGIGIPGNSKDLASVPLILSVPATVLSLTSKDKLKVRVSTVLGSSAPPLSVKLMQIFSSGSKDASVLKQELHFDPKEAIYTMEALPEGVDIGDYVFAFEIVLSDLELKSKYATGGRTKVPVFVTGVVKVDNAKVTLLEGDSVESEKKLDLPGKNDVALSANHLQKLHLSFLLTTPLGKPFKPHQVFLKLRHETCVEHIFVVENTGKQFKIALDFLGLVEKFFYLSGQYDIELTVGDAVMENSFLQPLGSIELDLPKAPEKATQPPPQAVSPYLRFGPKAEINHIFRVPEKRPPQEVSYAFLGLVLVPLLTFLVGLLRLGANFKNFPTSAVPATFAILFHGGIAAVLLLYVLFWLKLDLFTTLKTLGLLGIFFVPEFIFWSERERTLSHLASTAAKLKSA